MNIIAVDIGNTNITIGLFLKDEEQFIESIPGKSTKEITDTLKSAWDKIPIASNPPGTKSPSRKAQRKKDETA